MNRIGVGAKSFILVGLLGIFASLSFAGINNPGAAQSALGFLLLTKTGGAASVTATATETILATIAIPANTIGANGQIRLNTYWTMTSSANNKTLRFRLGTTGISSTSLINAVMTTVASVWFNTLIQNTNATNAQNAFSEGARGQDSLVATTLGTATADMTQLQNIYVTGQLVTTSETITLTGYSVEYAQ